MFKKITLVLVLLAATASVASCAGSASRAKLTAVGQAFATCAKADVGRTVADPSTAVIPAVLAIVAAGGKGWEDQLDALAHRIGDDAVTCAIAAIEAVLGAPAAGAASPSTHSATPAALARAREFHAVLDARRALGESFSGQ